MRVLFINTTDVSGGAAIVACRLMKGLQQYHQVESFYMVRYKRGESPATRTSISSVFEKLAERSIDKLTGFLGLQYLFFPFSSARILAYARKVKPDVISLHNTHGGYFSTPLLTRLSRIAPIAWTLHDMWSFTGNAAHTFGNTSWKDMKNDASLRRIHPRIGINTGSALLRLKKRIYSGSDITIITPSRWLKELAQQSPVFQGKKIFHIYNGVAESVFHKKDKALCRQQLGLPPGGRVLMFSAEHISLRNTWKGGGMLLEILKRINDQAEEEINLLILGSGDMKEIHAFQQFRIFHKGYVHSEETMADCLNAADVFIYPTRADNLPNVLVEAISCGTPCVSFDIGGCAEIIEEGRNGHIIPPFQFDSFAAKTMSLLNSKEKLSEFSTQCLKIWAEKFRMKDMADKYFQVFSVLQSKHHVTKD